MITCKECGHECSAQNALGFHLRQHGLKYVDYVVKHDHDGVWPTCKTCSTLLEHKKGGFGSFCSRSCASSGEHNGMHGLKGEQAPNFGVKRTEEQKQHHSQGAKKRWNVYGDQLREMMKTPDYRKAQSKAQVEGYIDDPERAERISKSVNAFWSSGSELSEQRRKEASDRAIDLLSQGKIGPQAPFKTEYKFNPFSNREEYMHSGWETELLDEAIALKLPLIKSHCIRIPYVKTSGYGGTYVPDFVCEEAGLIIEVKGEEDSDDLLKYVAGDLWCAECGWRYVVINDNADIKRMLKELVPFRDHREQVGP